MLGNRLALVIAQMTHLVNKLLTHWAVNPGLHKGGPSEQLLFGA